MRFALILVAAAMLSGERASAGVTECRVAPEAVRSAQLREVNAQRARHALQPLREDRRLTRAAQRHACDMGARRFFEHTGSDGSNPRTRAIGAGFAVCGTTENIAWGHYGVNGVVRVWMANANHRANILNRRLTHIGIGWLPRAPGVRAQFVHLIVRRC